MVVFRGPASYEYVPSIVSLEQRLLWSLWACSAPTVAVQLRHHDVSNGSLFWCVSGLHSAVSRQQRVGLAANGKMLLWRQAGPGSDGPPAAGVAGPDWRRQKLGHDTSHRPPPPRSRMRQGRHSSRTHTRAAAVAAGLLLRECRSYLPLRSRQLHRDRPTRLVPRCQR